MAHIIREEQEKLGAKALDSTWQYGDYYPDHFDRYGRRNTGMELLYKTASAAGSRPVRRIATTGPKE